MSILLKISILLLTVPAFGAVNINMDIISWIESSNNPNVVNKVSDAYGLYQITPVCLDDYLQYHPQGPDLIINDMLHPIIALIVADWYMNDRIPHLLRHYGKEDTINNRLIAYNCGIACVGRPLPAETEKYVNKYHRLDQ